jgi:hypothetical protein
VYAFAELAQTDTEEEARAWGEAALAAKGERQKSEHGKKVEA